ncbi:MAG TPA: glucose-6-phosphate dehydrogenase [Acidimicrobiales bacterium]|jgi:glucose-6-phosphate 1-dehydrogenase|nr:glucose-6-phosphate dehydrogenase [Acidimicrobiales bacterium]
MVDPRLVPEPTVFVLYGATGDLAHRLVLPAIYRLAIEGLLPEKWRLVGNGRGDVAHEDFRARAKDSLEKFGPKPSEGPWDQFCEALLFAGGGFDTNDPGCLLDVVGDAERALGGEPQRIHYMAVPPVAFTELTKAIGEHGLAERSRVVYEKPFGTSLESFTELDRAAHRVFDEQQIYRIDHFLGKEATQDIHVLRFANGLFAGAWDRQHIESVQIDVPESLDVSTRGSFYDATGAVLDMIVTHLFQLAAEVAMEPPASMDAEHIAAAREDVIGAFRPLSRSEVVLGQYDGYTDVAGVADGSHTETFVALRLWIDNDRWRDVPFYLRTGKCLAQSKQHVSVIFRAPPQALGDLPVAGNVLTFDLAGDGGIELSLVAKRPGVELCLGSASANLPLGQAFHTPVLPAYSRLIHDVFIGDRSTFTRPDGLAHVWEVAGALLGDKPEPLVYPRGSWGPDAAGDLPAPGHWLLGP